MADKLYFRRMIAKDIGVNVRNLTPDMVNEYITELAEKNPLYQEELKLRNYIPNWNK